VRALLGGAAFALSAVVAVAAGIAACSHAPHPNAAETRMQKLNEITTLWAQIRNWRREAMSQWRGRTVPEAARVCSEPIRVPPRCDDVCSLGDAICDNAERICTLADELGNDHLAQEKCTSAKASCREAKQRCCSCVATDAPAEGAL
jgi:hypothetical protein